MKGTRQPAVGETLSAATAERLRLLVGAGLVDSAVAARLGIHRTTVVRYRQQHGLQPGRTQTPLHPAELLNLRRIERGKTRVQSGFCRRCDLLADLAGRVMPSHAERRWGVDPRFAPTCPGSGLAPRDLDVDGWSDPSSVTDYRKLRSNL